MAIKPCNVCNGKGVGKPNHQPLEYIEANGGIRYQPIECQHCKGSGKEPENPDIN